MVDERETTVTASVTIKSVDGPEDMVLQAMVKDTVLQVMGGRVLRRVVLRDGALLKAAKDLQKVAHPVGVLPVQEWVRQAAKAGVPPVAAKGGVLPLALAWAVHPVEKVGVLPLDLAWKAARAMEKAVGVLPHQRSRKLKSLSEENGVKSMCVLFTVN